MRKAVILSLFMTLSLFSIFYVSNFNQAAFAGVEEGQKLFAQFCASCHGEKGKGDGPAAAMLQPKPRDLTVKANAVAKGDEHLFKVIKDGGTAVGLSPIMPGWGSALKDEQIKDIVEFIKSVAK